MSAPETAASSLAGRRPGGIVEPGTVDVPSAFLRRYHGVECTRTFEDRIGRCYELAAHGHANFYVYGWRDTTLVHGVFGSSGEGNPHAWVEFRIGGKRWVWDAVLDGIIPHEVYRDEWRARVWHRYTFQQAGAHVLNDEGFGPWGIDSDRYDARIRAIEEKRARERAESQPDASGVVP